MIDTVLALAIQAAQPCIAITIKDDVECGLFIYDGGEVGAVTVGTKSEVTVYQKPNEKPVAFIHTHVKHGKPKPSQTDMAHALKSSMVCDGVRYFVFSPDGERTEYTQDFGKCK